MYFVLTLFPGYIYSPTIQCSLTILFVNISTVIIIIKCHVVACLFFFMNLTFESELAKKTIIYLSVTDFHGRCESATL